MTGEATQQRAKLPLSVAPLVLTYLAIAMNMTIAAIALPTISTEFLATSGELSWVVAVTPMTSAAFLLFGGAWSDRYGAKRLLVIGMVVFLVAAVLSGFAPSIEALIAMRALTGVGSALAMPAALALVFTLTSGAAQRTAVGVMGGSQAIGALAGPVIGGAVIVTFGWQAAFWAVVPLLVVALVINVMALPADQPHAPRSLDAPAAVLVAVAGVAFLYAATAMGNLASAAFWLALAAGVSAVAALVVWERRAKDPLLAGSLLRRPSFLIPTLAVFTVQFMLGGLLFLNTQYVQLVLGFSALGAALFLLPALLVWTASAATAGISSARFGTVAVSVAAALIGALGLVLIVIGGSSPSYPVLLCGLALFGVLGVVPALMTHAAVSNYSADRRSVGSAINSIATRYGLAFGVAVLGLLLQTVYRRQLLATPAGATVDPDSDAAQSLGAAIQVGADVPGLVPSAQDAFAAGYSVVLIVAAGLLVGLAGVIAWGRWGGSIEGEVNAR